MPDRDIMLVPLTIKSSFDEDNYNLDMLAAVYNTPDLGRDRILPGAFSKTLRDKGNTRPIVWQHKIDEPIGKGVFTDTTKGLQATAKLPKADNFVSGRVIPQVNAGSIGGASIGYKTIDADINKSLMTRDLKTLDLFETSLVTIPMHPDAMILSVTKAASNMGVCEFKGMDKNLKNYIYTLMEGLEEKGVTPKKDYPFMDDQTAWDADKAIKQIRAATNSKDAPSADYKDGFMWYDSENSDKFTAYKLPNVYVVDGKMKIVPKAIYAIAAAISGSRGGLDIPAADKEKIKTRLNGYYKKLGKDSPFTDGKSFIDVDTLKFLSRKQISAILEGEENIEMSKASREYIVDCFKGQESGVGSIETKNSPVMDEFLKNLKTLNSQI